MLVLSQLDKMDTTTLNKSHASKLIKASSTWDAYVLVLSECSSRPGLDSHQRKTVHWLRLRLPNPLLSLANFELPNSVVPRAPTSIYQTQLIDLSGPEEVRTFASGIIAESFPC